VPGITELAARGCSLRLHVAAFVIHREQAPARVDDFLEPLLTDGHS
jgi:hypothetical protein